MAITKLDDVIAGFKSPRFFVKGPNANSLLAAWLGTHWASPGNPGAGAYDTTLNGVVLTNPVDGQIPFVDPSSGNSYLASYSASDMVSSSSTPQLVWLCDRLWHNGGYTITSTSAQNSTTPTWPARDDDGATNGKGVFLALEISATVGNANPLITISYTNSAGTSGRSGVHLTNFNRNNIAASTTIPITLQAGDIGVKSVESLTLSVSWVSGTINLVAYRVLGAFVIHNKCCVSANDVLTGNMRQMFSGTVPYFMFSANTFAAVQYLLGSFIQTEG